MNVKKFVACTTHPNCFAYQNGGCSILKDTKFRRDCPFFNASAHDETGFYYIDCTLDGTAEEIAANAGMDLSTLVAEAKAGSLFAYPSTPVEGDKLLTLSTCTYKFGGEANKDQRFVVFGRLLTARDDMPDTITLAENPSPKMPTF